MKIQTHIVLTNNLIQAKSLGYKNPVSTPIAKEKVNWIRKRIPITVAAHIKGQELRLRKKPKYL